MDSDGVNLDDLVNLTKALRDAGDEGKGLRKELYAGLNRATKPIRADVNAAVPPTFPQGGGLAGLMAKRARFSASTKTGRQVTGVRLVARGKGRRTLQTASQRGTIRHPVFGNRNVWVTQSAGVDGGKTAEAFEKDKPVAKREVIKAIADVREQIYRSVR